MSLWELFRKYPHWCFFIFAGVFLWGAVWNADSSERVEDYWETEAQICNVEAVQVFRRRKYVTRYNYDVVWYADGEEHVKHMEEEIDKVPEGERTIWVSMDGQKIALYSSKELVEESNRQLLIAAAAGIAGAAILVVRKKGRKGRGHYGKA